MKKWISEAELEISSFARQTDARPISLPALGGLKFQLQAHPSTAGLAGVRPNSGHGEPVLTTAATARRVHRCRLLFQPKIWPKLELSCSLGHYRASGQRRSGLEQQRRRRAGGGAAWWLERVGGGRRGGRASGGAMAGRVVARGWEGLPGARWQWAS
jgi:hypothetical protein